MQVGLRSAPPPRLALSHASRRFERQPSSDLRLKIRPAPRVRTRRRIERWQRAGPSSLLAVATWLRFYLMMTTGEFVIADLRRAVFGHVLTLSPAFFDTTRTGDIVSRVTNDSEQLRQVIGFGLSMFLRNGLMMIGALVLLFATSPRLAAFIVLGVPATLIPILA